jgi:hypothetical protein
MKTIINSIILVSVLQLGAFSQNRIASWDIDRISSISVEISTTDRHVKTLTFKTRTDIEKLITFLKEVSFSSIDTRNGDEHGDNDPWKYHLIFHGIQDQVFLFKSHAFIGKTDYRIDPLVPEKFAVLISGLK